MGHVSYKLHHTLEAAEESAHPTSQGTLKKNKKP